MPNVSGTSDGVSERAILARQAGAGGLLVAPGLVGFDTMRRLADADRMALPILSHPTFHGSFVTGPESEISHFALFGQMARLAGAAVRAFPNYGGRFSFSREDCRGITEAGAASMEHLRPNFAGPAGGMSLFSVPAMIEFYGADVVLLIGGGLHTFGSDLTANCRHFRRLAEDRGVPD